MNAEDRQRLAISQHQADLRAVMSTGAGRRFVWWLIEEVAALHSGSHCGEATHATAHHEGRRSVGRDLLREVQALAPKESVHMLTEAFSAQAEEQLLRAAENDAGSRNP